VKPAEHEHEFEAAHGLPEPLPSGERLLWQGSPDWRALAVRAMHVRLFALYFAAMLIWRAASTWADTGRMTDAALSLMVPLPLVAVALGLLLLLAWLTSRTTVYTLTDQRLVMRIGIVLSVTFNLPYRQIESAALRLDENGTGDIALVLAPGDRIAYFHLWPHARPWRLKRTEPMLRSLVQAGQVAQLLSKAIADVPLGERVAATTPSTIGRVAMAQQQGSPGSAPVTA
jgi:hypothetical protein